MKNTIFNFARKKTQAKPQHGNRENWHVCYCAYACAFAFCYLEINKLHKWNPLKPHNKCNEPVLSRVFHRFNSHPHTKPIRYTELNRDLMRVVFKFFFRFFFSIISTSKCIAFAKLNGKNFSAKAYFMC